MPSREISKLHPRVAAKCRALLDAAREEGIELLVTATLRTYDEQEQLYAIGRTKPGKRVTNAKPGHSWHNFGLAFDVVPTVQGKPVWNSPMWDRIGALGESVGLEWGGRWETFRDRPHFQFTGGLTMAAAREKLSNMEPLFG